MQITNLIGLACGLALLTPTAANAATASISGPDTVTRGQAEQFIASCVGCNGGLTYYEWDRDNDGQVPDEDKGLFRPIIFHAFTGELGQRTIRVYVEGRDVMTGAATGSATATKTVTVVNATPELEFSCDPRRVETREAVTCELDRYEDPDDQDSHPAYAWDVDGDGFDDGTGDELTTSYATAGEKTVRMRATDDDGGHTIAEAGVEVWQPPVGPAFTMSATEVVEGSEVTFTAPLAAGEEGDVAYDRRWDFDGDGEWDESGVGKRSVSASFDEPGTYGVRLHVRAEGQPETATITTQQLVVRAGPVVEDKPRDEAKGGGGSGGTVVSGGGAGTGSAASATTPAPAFLPVAAGTTGPEPAAKKPAARKAKTCKAAKRKKGKRSRSCAATRKASRAKSRKRR